MKKLALVFLRCIILPVQHAVVAQQDRALRFANDWCYPRVDDNGWGSIVFARYKSSTTAERPTSAASHPRGRPTVCASRIWPAASTSTTARPTPVPW